MDLVKLDSGRVLIRENDKWDEKATHVASRRVELEDPSMRILANVLREKKTFWKVPEISVINVRPRRGRRRAGSRSQRAMSSAPLYGERRLMGAEIKEPISQLEAMLVEVLASGVAAGLSRVEQEQAALRTRLQWEQFMTPRLAARLVDHPELLVGRDTDITVLFCDIRGFSRITEKLGPAKTVELMSDVMNVLTECVMDRDGVVVDYVGDEVMAMWGAPEDQPDHAARVAVPPSRCSTSLPTLNERWQAIVNEPLNFGIGINSGSAQVGNVGSTHQAQVRRPRQYRESREPSSGHDQVPQVVLADHGSDAAAPRRPASYAKFVSGPRRQHRAAGRALRTRRRESSGLGNLKRDYEHALDEFSRGNFRQACHILGRVILDHPNDGPSLILLRGPSVAWWRSRTRLTR